MGGEERREQRRESEEREEKDHSPSLLGVMVLIHHTELHASVSMAGRDEHKCYKHQQRQTRNYFIS